MLEKNANTRINDFTDLIEIGKGGFGVVYSAKRLNGEPVALKKIDRSVPRDRVWNEVRSLKRLRHRKIVEFYEDFEVNGETYVVMELCEYGSVRSYVKKHGPLPDAVAAHVLRQMMSAVTYMHRREVLHRDLSAGNILIKSIKDGFLNVKLGDFGLATNLRRGETACTVVGTPGYIAPQVFNQDYDETADVYSLGGVLYTMLTAGDPPRNGRLNFDGLSHSAVALIKKMMHPDVHSRISLNAISTMDFMRDLDEGGYSRDVSTERRGFSRDRRTSVERTRRSRDAQLERNNNWDQNWQPAKPPTRSASQPPVLSRRSSNNAERPNGVPSRPSPLDPRAKPVDEDLPPWPLKFARCAGNRVKTKGGRYIVENDFRVRFEVAQKGDLIARVIIAEINSRGDQQRLLVHNTLSRNEPAREENDPLIELDRAPKVFTRFELDFKAEYIY
ncbi:unnamed protein product [Caenorhabditis auriculariae]|uniref:Protein kinase domain-containing protein n=1 Tax=Caenorhabditis auriculariae TaxID=2777116 RepID=A0A8S1HL90_9PELO|nr:unnamed protein product [Caenorhabditis auriculariae]